jgi:transcription antitermination factor NusG
VDKKPKSDKTKSESKVKPNALSIPPKWVIVQLTHFGEREKNIQSIVRNINKMLGKPVDVFVPAVSQKVRDESQTMFYMDGYIFIRYEENINYLKLNDTVYFNSVLTQISFVNGERKKTYSLLDDKQISPMRVGVQNLKIGVFKENQNVKIIKGKFKGLQAVVSYTHEDNEHIQVYIKLRSKLILMDFPTSYIQEVKE